MDTFRCAFWGTLGWSDGAMVPGKLPVPGCPTGLDDSGPGVYCGCSGCRCGLFWIFFSYLLFLFFLPLSGKWTDID